MSFDMSKAIPSSILSGDFSAMAISLEKLSVEELQELREQQREFAIRGAGFDPELFGHLQKLIEERTYVEPEDSAHRLG